MSLFENDEFQWRETYFILIDESRRPLAEDVANRLRRLNAGYEIRDVRADDSGKFESLTLISPDDYAAMDITFVCGDDVAEQTTELVAELLKTAGGEQEKSAIKQLSGCRCRFDVYHFEQLVFVGRDSEDDEDDFMDPGALLIVMDKIATLCKGVVVDPQANVIL
jgi:hypothetical protein